MIVTRTARGPTTTTVVKLHDAKWHVRILEQIIHFFDRYLQDDGHKTTSFIFFLKDSNQCPDMNMSIFISYFKAVYNNIKEIDTLFNNIVLKTGIEISAV